MRPEPLRGDGVFAPAAFERDDDAPDDRFYALARKVVHIDDRAIAALGRLYAEVLPAGGAPPPPVPHCARPPPAPAAPRPRPRPRLGAAARRAPPAVPPRPSAA